MKAVVVAAVTIALGLAPAFVFAEPDATSAPMSSEQPAAAAPEGGGCMPGGGCCGSCQKANPTTGEAPKLECPCKRRARLLEEQRKREAEQRGNAG